MTSVDLEGAISLAVRAHRNSTRKGKNVPYIVHPMGAMRIALEYGYSDEIAAAAVLHDALEDNPSFLEERDIVHWVGPGVFDLVAGVTKTEYEDKMDYARGFAGKPHGVRVVKACDALDNLAELRRDHAKLGDAVYQRFRGGRDRVTAYYHALADAIKGDDPLFADLNCAVRSLLPAPEAKR
jgi:(p)ppGpp synthase/HD superfamily hydrolase